MAADAPNASAADARCALVVLDGLGDRPNPATGGVSPVEAAATPHLDRLARLGEIGDVVVVAPGVAPESDAGVFALLGYDPVRDSPGRGVLEAIGVEIPLGPGDVALRLNFATSDGEGRILDSRVGRSLTTHEAEELARSLSAADLLGPEGIHAEVRATVGHRGVLWLHPTDGGRLSAATSNADPYYEKVGGMGQARRVEEPKLLEVRALDTSSEAARTAEAVNLFLARAAPVLAGHRVNARRALAGKRIGNALLVRNAGTPPTPGHPAPFASARGRAGASVTEMPVERGIASVLGLEDRFVGPMGADRDAGYRERAKVAREMLARFPFVYIHLKGPDEPGHDGDAVLKRTIVEAIDRSFFGPFLDGLDLDAVRIAVTADHATPAVAKGHTDDPVPLLLVGPGVPPSGAPVKFGEAAARAGKLGHRRGADVLPLLFGTLPLAG